MTTNMINRLRSYHDGVHRDFFLAVANVVEGQNEKLELIRAIATGEAQVAEDDTSGMEFIVKIIDGEV